MTIYSLRNVLLFINCQKVYSKYFASFCRRVFFLLSGLISKDSIFQLRIVNLNYCKNHCLDCISSGTVLDVIHWRNSSNLFFPYIARTKLSTTWMLSSLIASQSSGIELTSFKWFVKKTKCRRFQGPAQSRNFWSFINCFSRVFFGKEHIKERVVL